MSAGVVFFGGLFALVGTAVALGGVLKLREAFTIWRSDPVPVREAAQDTGMDEFEGMIEPTDEHGTFEAPFTGKEAVISTYKVERRERSSSNSRGSNKKWKTIERGAIRQPFLVRDETGCVRVDPTDADISADNESTRETASSSLSADVRLRLSVLTDKIDLENVLAQKNSRRRRYSEGYLQAGDEVHVYGSTLAERSPHGVEYDAVVESAPEESLYRISAGTEADTISGLLRSGAGLFIFGLIFASVGLGVMISEGLIL